MTRCSGSLSLAAALLTLVTDGVFQGLGALQIISSFVLPETRTVALRDDDGSPALAFSISPVHFGRGANGLMAIGDF